MAIHANLSALNEISTDTNGYQYLTQLREVENPETGIYEISDVWYMGCKWRCAKTGTTTTPAWNNTDWAMVWATKRVPKARFSSINRKVQI